MGDRILVVDDEPAFREILKETVLQDDAERQVDVAKDGLDALEKVRATSYQLLLSDLSMPRMNGLELIKVLHDEFPQLPVVVITSLGDEEKILHCFSCGAWDYITKPFKLGHVKSAVRRALVASAHVRMEPGDMEVTAMGPGWLEITAVSELEYVNRFRKFTEMLLGARVPGEILEDVRVAVEEIGRNAIEWGNRFDVEKRIRLGFRVMEDRILLKVEDEGQGFDPNEVPDPSVDPVAHVLGRTSQGKRPGGYGIHLLRQMMDDVSFADNGRSVLLTKYLSG